MSHNNHKTKSSTVASTTQPLIPKPSRRAKPTPLRRAISTLLSIFIYSSPLLVVLVALIVKQLYDIDAFRSFPSKANLSCRALRGITGLEDAQFVPNTNLLLLAGDDRSYIIPRSGQSAKFGERIAALDKHTSSIATINLNDQKPDIAHCLIINFPEQRHFHTHGLSILNNHLYVINHVPEGEHIDVFDLTKVDGVECVVTFLYSLSHALFTSINDLVVFKDESKKTHLYVTVDTLTKDETLKRWIELYTARPWGSVLHCTLDESARKLQCRTVATGLAFTNGVAVSEDHKLLYVVETTGRFIRVYEIAKDKSLTLRTSIPTPFFAPDNINISRDGSLIVGGHPSILHFVRHAYSTTKRKRSAPSQVIRIRSNSGPDFKDYSIENLYEAFDGQLSGSSVGIVHNNKLVIGSAMDDGALICDFKQNS